MLVLVVDHDASALAMTARSLEAAGCDVDATTSFTDARRLLLDRPDAVVADVRLGEFNGLHLAMLARNADPDVQIVITGRREDSAMRSDVEALDATFVQKPCTAPEISALVVEHAAPRAMVCRTSRHQHVHPA